MTSLYLFGGQFPFQDQPRLVVFLVIDQGTPKLIQKYDNLFNGGIRFLIDNGYNFSQTFIDYSSTSTGPGHFSLASGVYPGSAGIIGNQWYDRSLGRSWYCAEDTLSFTLIEKKKGSSYKNVNATTLGDWLKKESPKSKVISVSGKDRSAVMMGGKNPDGAYWYNKKGAYTTSSYYKRTLPWWVKRFNKNINVESYIDSSWNFLFDKKIYDDNTRADYFFGESDWTTKSGYNPTLPIEFNELDLSRLLNLFYVTPFGDRSLLNFAESAIKKHKMGNDQFSDLLFIGLSATDGVGHSFGPNSQEQLDNLLRLDRNLGLFINSIERSIGKGNTLFVLTSDHGVEDLPEFLADKGFDSGRISSSIKDSITQTIIEKINLKFGPKSVTPYGNGFYYRKSLNIDERNEIDLIIKDLIIKIPGVGMVLTQNEIMTAGDSDIEIRLKNMVHPVKSPDIIFIPRKYWSTRSQSGATHGTPYDYDAHIPFFISSSNFKKKEIKKRVSSIDIAPTISNLLNISSPKSIDGKIIKIFED